MDKPTIVKAIVKWYKKFVYSLSEKHHEGGDNHKDKVKKEKDDKSDRYN
jgi:hypothetical protein